MRVIVSVAVSVNGYIDSAEAGRLKLSSAEDFYDVHALRAECDAILVGAGTIRKDNPSLVTKHEELLQLRRDKGLPDDPIKVTITRGGVGGGLPMDSDFFTRGDNEKWVFCSGGKDKEKGKGERVIFFSWDGDLRQLLSELEKRGVKTLLVEGGSEVLTQFFSLGLVDHLRLAVAPFFVSGAGAPRFVEEGEFLHDVTNRMQLLSVRQLGDMVVIDYGCKNAD